MTRKKRDAGALPVYDIDTFRSKNTRGSFFDVKILDEHIREFKFVSQPHRHNCYLILVVTQGSGMHTIDFRHYSIEPWSVFFMTPGQVHSWELSDDIKGYVVFFTSSFYTSGDKRLTEFPFFQPASNQCRVVWKVIEKDVLLLAMKEMVNENNAENPWRESLLRNYLDILIIRSSRYLAQVKEDEAGYQLTRQLRQLQSLIDLHFRQLKLPRDYAEKMSITPNHLNDLCKRTVDKTVTELIHERTLLECKRLLIHTDITIKQIADDLGFSDKSHFARFFKKHTGETPDHFRAHQLNIPQHP